MNCNFRILLVDNTKISGNNFIVKIQEKIGISIIEE